MRISDGIINIDVESVTGKPFEVEVGKFENAQTDNIDLAKEWALWLEEELKQPFGNPGTRNQAAVNVSCLLRALGVDDGLEWIENVDKIIENEANDSGLMNFENYGPLRSAFQRVWGTTWGGVNYINRWDDGKGGIVKFMV